MCTRSGFLKSEAKGIGNSTTLSQDAADRETAHRVLLSLSESVAGRLRRSGQSASMVSTEIKYNTFKKVSHQTTLLTPTSQTDIIYQTACYLFDEIWDGTPVRLLGIRSSKLTAEGEPVQLSLFDLPVPAQNGPAEAGLYAGRPASRRKEQLDQALDAIRSRYGADAVVRGSLLSGRSAPAQKAKKEQPEGDG